MTDIDGQSIEFVIIRDGNSYNYALQKSITINRICEGGIYEDFTTGYIVLRDVILYHHNGSISFQNKYIYHQYLSIYSGLI
jgi:hypothetical protein